MKRSIVFSWSFIESSVVSDTRLFPCKILEVMEFVTKLENAETLNVFLGVVVDAVAPPVVVVEVVEEEEEEEDVDFSE